MDNINVKEMAERIANLCNTDVETINTALNCITPKSKEFEKRYMGKWIFKNNDSEDNRRITQALQRFKGECKSYIIDNYCPYDMDKNLEDLDPSTFSYSNEVYVAHERGCRGITCEECWDKEL